MLDGKFSVYNSSGGSEAPSAEIKKPSPINFKYEWCQSATLSFDDELRLAMEKFHQSKQPSAAKVAVKKWLNENTPNFLKFNTKEQKPIPLKAKEEKEFKIPKFLQFNAKTSDIKTKTETFEFKTKPETLGFKIPKLFQFEAKTELLKNKPTTEARESQTLNFITNFGKKLSKILDFGSKINLPEFPKINLPKAFVTKKAAQIEKKLEAIEKPLIDVYEKTKHVVKKIREKTTDLYEEFLDKIPVDKIQEIWTMIQEIPQLTIIPAAIWMASFIPTDTIRLSFLSGIRRISNAAHKMFDFANRSYKFTARQTKKVANYLNQNLIQPVAYLFQQIFNWIFNIVAGITKWLYSFLKRGIIASYRFFRKSPKYLWSLSKSIWKGISRLTMRVVRFLAE